MKRGGVVGFLIALLLLISYAYKAQRAVEVLGGGDEEAEAPPSGAGSGSGGSGFQPYGGTPAGTTE